MDLTMNTFKEDLEDGELPEMETVTEFIDGYDENFLGDEADRIRLARLTELERERELYERCVKREEQMFRWKVRNKLRKDYMSEVKKRSNSRRLQLKVKPVAHKRRRELDLLLEKRNHKKNRDEGVIVKHITADDEEDEKEEQVLEIQPSESSFLSKKLKLKACDVYSDDSSSSTDEEDNKNHSEPVILVQSLPELGTAILTRNQLEDFLDKPIFDQTVIGCFVRVSIGPPLNGQPSIYRLSEIVGLDSIDEEYQLGSRRTKRLLQLKHGKYQSSFLMSCISNQPVTTSEFSFFLESCQRDAQPLPSLNRISEKEMDIKKATDYVFTERDVELMVQTKRQAGQKRGSAAYRKVRLIIERDAAIESMDREKARQLEQEIRLIDEKSFTEQRRAKRAPYISSNIAPRHRLKPSQSLIPKNLNRAKGNLNNSRRSVLN